MGHAGGAGLSALPQRSASHSPSEVLHGLLKVVSAMRFLHVERYSCFILQLRAIRAACIREISLPCSVMRVYAQFM